MALTNTAHQLIRAHFEQASTAPPRHLAVDATCGNGHDTLFLTQLGFGKVIGFDIQALALRNTQARLAAAGFENVELHNHGHEQLAETIEQPINCIMFNFGYLPKADKSIFTESETSIQALNSSLQLLTSDGIISLMCYPGHEAGQLETHAIQGRLAQLPKTWQVARHLSTSPTDKTPILYLITRTKP